jgi:uncharacterized membrane protein (DUF2068 family)
VATPRAAPQHRNTGLRLIAALKVAKGLLLTGIALGLFHAINHDLGETMRKAAVHLRIDPENRIFRAGLERATNIPPKTLRTFGLISLVYAAELYVEGIGLWLNQAWAKYLVVVATAIFVPEEVRACLLHFAWERAGLLVVNLAVLFYVIWVLWHPRHRRPDPA